MLIQFIGCDVRACLSFCFAMSALNGECPSHQIFSKDLCDEGVDEDEDVDNKKNNSKIYNNNDNAN